MTRSDRPILLAFPCLDEVKTEFFMSVCMLMARSVAKDGLWLGASCVRGTNLAASREETIKQAIATDSSHIFMLDSDIRFPAETLMQLLSYRQRIVGATYCMRREPRALVHRLEDGTSNMPEGDALFEVQSVGLGCILIETNVFKDILYGEGVNRLEPLFQMFHTRDPRDEVTEDVYFCRRLRKHGERIWIDPVVSRAIRHIGEYPYSIADAQIVKNVDEQFIVPL